MGDPQASIFTAKERKLIAAQLRAHAAIDWLRDHRPGWALGAEYDFPHDRGQVQALQSDHKIRVLIPGNGFGKTTCMGMDADMLMQRDDPFKPHLMPEPDRPTAAVWFCQKYQQWEIMRGDLEANVFTRGWSWKEQKHMYQWPNESRLYVLSSDSDWTAIQGVQIDAVYFDEHPDRKFWNEMMYRRRGRKKTRYMVAATMTQGITWFVTGIIQPWEAWNREQGRTNSQAIEAQDHRDTFVWNIGGIEDNPGMDEEDREHYESVFTASEKERHVRLKGGYADFVGEPVFDLEALEALKAEHEQEGETGRVVFVGDDDETVRDRLIRAAQHAGYVDHLGHRWAGVLDQEFFAFHPGLPVDRGRITVFEPPDEQLAGNYIIGADFAYGLVGKDYDAAVVGVKTADGQVRQVAEAVGHWGDIFFAETLYALGVWYFEAFIAGERQVGLPTMRRMYDEMGYSYFLMQRRQATRGERVSDLLGHHASAGDTVIPNLRLAIKRHDFIPRSGELIRQLIRYQFRPRKKNEVIDDVTDSMGLTTGAPEGEHDDLARAASYLWHGAREIVHFAKPDRPYRPGTFGEVFEVDKVLKKRDRRKPVDPYAIR